MRTADLALPDSVRSGPAAARAWAVRPSSKPGKESPHTPSAPSWRTSRRPIRYDLIDTRLDSIGRVSVKKEADSSRTGGPGSACTLAEPPAYCSLGHVSCDGFCRLGESYKRRTSPHAICSRIALHCPDTCVSSLPNEGRNTPMRTALGYVRVGTDEHADRGLGLEAQRQRAGATVRRRAATARPGVSGGKALAYPASAHRAQRAGLCRISG